MDHHARTIGECAFALRAFARRDCIVFFPKIVSFEQRHNPFGQKIQSLWANDTNRFGQTRSGQMRYDRTNNLVTITNESPSRTNWNCRCFYSFCTTKQIYACLLLLYIQVDQLYIAVYFWFLVKRDFCSVHYCTLASLFTRYQHGHVFKRR